MGWIPVYRLSDNRVTSKWTVLSDNRVVSKWTVLTHNRVISKCIVPNNVKVWLS